jgi:hypothetical protein
MIALRFDASLVKLRAPPLSIYHLLNQVLDGLSRASLPAIPALIISIPIISKAIPMSKPAKAAPKNGDTSIITDIMTARTPTPM